MRLLSQATNCESTHEVPVCGARRLSELSAPRQALLRLCRSMGFGYVLDLHVRNGEPVFDPRPRVVRDIKLVGEEAPSSHVGIVDFQLPQEARQLFTRMEELGFGCIQRVEIRAGIPRRIVMEVPFLSFPL